MQDPSTYSQVKPQFPEQEHLKCPRCDSSNTKFCYYNNYNLSQPRHFCKNCRRYWTKGGTLRNIPIGGGSRKNTKRSSNPKRSSTLTSQAAQPPKQEQPSSASALLYDQVCSASDLNQDRSLLEIGGSFSSLLEGNGQFGDMLEGLNSNGSPSLQLGEFAENLKNSGLGSNLMRNPIVEFQGSKNSEGFLGVQNGGDSSCWSGTNANGWPDLAINAPTPGSSFKQTKVANFERENVS